MKRSVATMYCESCGAIINDYSRFCFKCGKSTGIDNHESIENINFSMVPSDYYLPYSDDKKIFNIIKQNKKVVIISILCFVLILLIIVSIVSISYRNIDNNNISYHQNSVYSENVLYDTSKSAVFQKDWYLKYQYYRESEGNDFVSLTEMAEGVNVYTYAGAGLGSIYPDGYTENADGSYTYTVNPLNGLTLIYYPSDNHRIDLIYPRSGESFTYYPVSEEEVPYDTSNEPPTTGSVSSFLYTDNLGITLTEVCTAGLLGGQFVPSGKHLILKFTIQNISDTTQYVSYKNFTAAVDDYSKSNAGDYGTIDGLSRIEGSVMPHKKISGYIVYTVNQNWNMFDIAYTESNGSTVTFSFTKSNTHEYDYR